MMRNASSTSRFDFPGLWPTPDQMLVLRAALFDDASAKDAFLTWVRSIDLEENFDGGTFRLLPLLHANLLRQGIEHPLMNRLKGVYRMAWYKNLQLFHAVSPVLATLQSAQIPIFLLKGIPLALKYYPSHAQRPMADVDILVPQQRVIEADAILRGLGFTADIGRPVADCLRFTHSLDYYQGDISKIDLHWRVLPFHRLSAESVYWNTAQPLDFNGLDSLMPDPTRLLFHTVVHGVCWNPLPPVRWIADSVFILRGAGSSIRWDELVEFAHQQCAVNRLLPGLSFLKEKLDVDIPGDAIAELKRHGTTLIEVIDNICIVRNDKPETTFGRFLAAFGTCCRLLWTQKPIPFLMGILDGLKFWWRLQRKREIVPFVARTMLRKFKAFVVSAAPLHRMPRP